MAVGRMRCGMDLHRHPAGKATCVFPATKVLRSLLCHIGQRCRQRETTIRGRNSSSSRGVARGLLPSVAVTALIITIVLYPAARGLSLPAHSRDSSSNRCIPALAQRLLRGCGELPPSAWALVAEPGLLLLLVVVCRRRSCRQQQQ